MTFSAGSGRSPQRRTSTHRRQSATTRDRHSAANAAPQRSPRPSAATKRRATTSSAAASRATGRTRRSATTPPATSTQAKAGHRKPTRATTVRQKTAIASRSMRALPNKLQPLVLPSDLPHWLRSLLKVQHSVWVSTIVLSTVALGTYGWSVYSQQQWGQAYGQLQRLQRNERQLISGKELMKNEIAQQVDPQALGLAPQKPNNVIFIKPDNQTTAVNPPPIEADIPATQPAKNQPMGY